MKTLKIASHSLIVALVATFTMAFTSPALANDEKKALPVELKYAGIMKNQPLFYMNFNSTEVTEYVISIRDIDGNVLYKEVVKGTQFTKRYLLNTDELGDAPLKFEISSKSYEKPVVFEVNNQARLVQDIVVNKIK